MNLPIQYQNPNLRLCKLGSWNKWFNDKPLGKKPLGYNWQVGLPFNHPEIQNHWGNIGLIAGHDNIRFIDCDIPEIADQLLPIFKDTLVTKTGNRGIHITIRSSYDINHELSFNRDHAGEYRAVGQMCVIPPSRHPNGNYYFIYNDNPIKTYPASFIKKVLSPYINNNSEQAQSINNKTNTKRGDKPYSEDKSRKEMKRIVWMVAQGYSKDHIFQQMEQAEKWHNETDNYKNRTYNRAVAYVGGKK